MTRHLVRASWPAERVSVLCLGLIAALVAAMACSTARYVRARGPSPEYEFAPLPAWDAGVPAPEGGHSSSASAEDRL